MYIIVTTGGKQYRTRIGHTFIVNDMRAAELMIVPCSIILAANTVDAGKQYFAFITRVMLLKGKKQIGIKFKRRKNYIRRFGFRQPTITLRVTGIFSHGVLK